MAEALFKLGTEQLNNLLNLSYFIPDLEEWRHCVCQQGHLYRYAEMTVTLDWDFNMVVETGLVPAKRQN